MKVVADALTFDQHLLIRQLAPIVVQSLVAMVFAAIEVWSLSAAPIPRETLDHPTDRDGPGRLPAPAAPQLAA